MQQGGPVREGQSGADLRGDGAVQDKPIGVAPSEAHCFRTRRRDRDRRYFLGLGPDATLVANRQGSRLVDRRLNDGLSHLHPSRFAALPNSAVAGQFPSAWITRPLVSAAIRICLSMSGSSSFPFSTLAARRTFSSSACLTSACTFFTSSARCRSLNSSRSGCVPTSASIKSESVGTITRSSSGRPDISRATIIFFISSL